MMYVHLKYDFSYFLINLFWYASNLIKQEMLEIPSQENMQSSFAVVFPHLSLDMQPLCDSSNTWVSARKWINPD